MSLGRSDTFAIRNLAELAAQPNTEFEIRFKDVIYDWQDYQKILTSLMKKGKVETSRSMTVSNKNENAYVSGITRFEKTYEPTVKSQYTFKKVTGSHEIKWLKLRVVVSLEEPVEARKDLRFNTFRYRVRQSITIGAWRYDLTRVVGLDLDTTLPAEAKTFAEKCNALPVDAEWPCNYEMEAEYVGSSHDKELESIMSGPIHEVYSAIGRNLTKILIDNTIYPLIREWVPGVSTFRNLMNKPVPLTRERLQHLTEESFGVSLKADGERTFLFVNNNLNQVYVIKAAGIDPQIYRLVPPKQKKEPDEPEVGTYLIDGEMRDNTFWIFDCLVFIRNVTGHRFKDRYQQLEDKFPGYKLEPVRNKEPESKNSKTSGKKKESWGDIMETYTLQIKPFPFSEKPSDIYDIVRKITEGRRMDGEMDAKAGFGIDGVIFQAAASEYFNKRTYKWKPIEMNSIDFLVKVVKSDATTQTLRLYVGASLAIYERFTHNKVFDLVTFPQLPKNATYGPMPFVVPGGQQMSTTIVPHKVMKIEDNSIYEFIYGKLNPEAKDSPYGWIPIRHREDRTAEYRKGTFFGNNYDVACEAWETIRNPIPLESLTSPTKLTGGGYWAKPGQASGTGIGRYTSMVKAEIYCSQIKAGSRLLEISGGRGGDINRWERCRVSQVTNLDSDAAAIDEMYARLNELYRVKPELRESMPVTGVVDNVLTTDFKGEFDAVSCMFAIHYFLRNEADFTQFFNLVDRCLVKNGVLLITSLDGNKVLQELAARGKDTPRGRLLTLGTHVSIRAPEPLGAIRNFGQKIAVTVSSIGEEHEEYLVNYNYVHKFFRTRGYVVRESKSFDQIPRKTDQRLTVEESAYISMARYLIIRKN